MPFRKALLLGLLVCQVAASDSGIPFAPYADLLSRALSGDPFGAPPGEALATTAPFSFSHGEELATLHPSGKFVFLANPKLKVISVLRLKPDSHPAPISGSPFRSGDAPDSLLITPDGKFLYMANQLHNEVLGFGIEQDSGALSPLPVKTRHTSTPRPDRIAIDRTGRGAFTLSAGVLSTFQVDNATGALSHLADLALSISPRVPDLMVTASNETVLVLDRESGEMEAFSFSLSEKKLTLITPPTRHSPTTYSAKKIRPEEFGAVADGVHDDGPAIQKAVDSLKMGGTISFSAGTYRIGDTIEISHPGILFQGVVTPSGSWATLTPAMPLHILIHIKGQPDVRFRNLRFFGVASTELGTEALEFENGSDRFEVSHCFFGGVLLDTGFNIQVNVANCNYGLITGCHFEQCVGTHSGNGYGILCSNRSLANRFIGNDFDFSSSGRFGGRHGIYLSSGTSFSFVRGNTLINCKDQAITTNATPDQTPCVANVVVWNTIRGNGRYAIGVNIYQRDSFISGNDISDVVEDGIWIQSDEGSTERETPLLS